MKYHSISQVDIPEMETLDDHTLSHVHGYCREMYLELRLVSKTLYTMMSTRGMALDHLRYLYGNDVYDLMRKRDDDVIRYITHGDSWIPLIEELYPEVAPHIIGVASDLGEVLQKNLGYRVGGRARMHLIKLDDDGMQVDNPSMSHLEVFYGDLIYTQEKRRYCTATYLCMVADVGGTSLPSGWIPREIIERCDFPLTYWAGHRMVLETDEMMARAVYVPGASYSYITYMGVEYKVMIAVMECEYYTHPTRPHIVDDLTPEEFARVLYLSVTYDSTAVFEGDDRTIFWLRRVPYIMDMDEGGILHTKVFPAYMNCEYLDE